MHGLAWANGGIFAAAMSSDEQETYIPRLAKLGYCWQFITLAGLHTNALISGMLPSIVLLRL
jgi:isocitrate lyase